MPCRGSRWLGVCSRRIVRAPDIPVVERAVGNPRSGRSEQADSVMVGEMVGQGGPAMRQATFAELEHDMKKRRTRREVFLGKRYELVVGQLEMPDEQGQ